MATDDITWEEAHKPLEKIIASNRHLLGLYTLPYKIGIITAVMSGLVSFPLIFHYDSVLWFNEAYVTCDLPEAKDLETPLEVGGVTALYYYYTPYIHMYTHVYTYIHIYTHIYTYIH